MVERTQQEYLLAQANLVEQARDAAQLAVRRVQEVENRIGDVRGDVRDVRDQTVDARDEVNQRKAEIEAIIGASVPDHEWNGESLRLRNPDGEWGDYTNLKGATGNDGWSPILAIVADGARFVAQVTGWIGGAGTEPATGLYVGPTGYVATAPEAADIRGGIGPIGPAPTLTAGTVTTGAPGSPVEFTVRAVSPGVYEVDVSIPEGLPGLDGGSTAALVEFDNASNGFTADDVQAAIEELIVKLGAVPVGVQLLTTSGLYTRSPGVTRALIIALGGGQAGGGINNSNGSGIGGESGEVRCAVVSPGATESVTIGARGTGSSSPGAAGGNTSFGSHVTARGGANSGGSGGIPFGPFGPLTPGQVTGSQFTATGGSPAFGLGRGAAATIAGDSSGQSGVGYGAGGGGANGFYTGTQDGGSGTAGCILVLEFK